MSVLATGSKIREIGNLGSGVTDEMLTPHIAIAVVKLKAALSSTVYEAVVSYEGSTDADKAEEFDAVQQAENYLALSYAFHSLNVETQGSGIVRSKGWDSSRSDLMSRNEIKDLSEHYREIAYELIQPYIPEELDDDETDVINTGNLYMAFLDE